ncbi:MAG: RteC domain-containing protein [Bacteroidetes bacterium]|nr:RteC domain-containing protein [Bacteroidota bacterium]
MKKIVLLLDEFNASICEIEKANLDKLLALDKKIKITKDCLQQFRIAIRKDGFSSQKDEIQFFKHQKPYIQGRLKYYTNLNTYLLKKPFASLALQSKFINTQLNKLDTDNCLLLKFVKYSRLNENYNDKILFLRSNNQFDLFTDTTRHSDDPEFSTNYDYLATEVTAIDLLKTYYSKELKLLKKLDPNTIVEQVKPAILDNFSWTGTKTELVELIYALNTTGCINNGQTEMKIIIDICKELFNIELGNIYKTFNEIKDREKDPTKFLNKLTINLSKRINSEQ